MLGQLWQPVWREFGGTGPHRTGGSGDVPCHRGRSTAQVTRMLPLPLKLTSASGPPASSLVRAVGRAISHRPSDAPSGSRGRRAPAIQVASQANAQRTGRASRDLRLGGRNKPGSQACSRANRGYPRSLTHIAGLPPPPGRGSVVAVGWRDRRRQAEARQGREQTSARRSSRSLATL